MDGRFAPFTSRLASMKTYDIRDDQGRVRGLEMDNASISRGAVIRILKSVPGLVVTRSLAWYRLDKENFCEFELGGLTFKAAEPNDERSRFWIGPSADGDSPQIDPVKSAFLRYRTPLWIVPARILSSALLGFGSLIFGLSLVRPSPWGFDQLTFWSGGLIVAGMILMACNVLRLRNGG